MLCLRVATDAEWAVAAMRDIDALLVDHAHCELKAASHALSLVARYPDDLELAMRLTELAQEEVAHFHRVLALLAKRGVKLGPPPVDDYAASLRRAASALSPASGAGYLVDRLLVAALIEARSCERFKLLADAGAPAPEDGRARGGSAEDGGVRGSAEDGRAVSLWAELFAAEAGHYRTFIELAERAAGDRARVAARLDVIAEAEARIVRALPARAAGGSRASIHG
jgi:tRNA-(ms[2]io[6]A)-hydroxylase